MPANSCRGAAGRAPWCDPRAAASGWMPRWWSRDLPQSTLDTPIIVNIGQLWTQWMCRWCREASQGSRWRSSSAGLPSLRLCWLAPDGTILSGFQGFDELVGADAFQVESKEGHFKLRASLPGYTIQSSAGSEKPESNENPLSVEVVGRSLVVRGSKKEGRFESVFQRSFMLPRAADVDHISAVYNDGVLAVDVPASGNLPEHMQESEGGEWRLNTEASGSHTSIIISGGGAGQLAPSLLRGGGTCPSSDVEVWARNSRYGGFRSRPTGGPHREVDGHCC
nr:small heat shock protein sHsp30.1 [Dinophyceae sp.]